MCKTCVQKTRSAVRVEETLLSFLKIKQDWNGMTVTDIIQLNFTKSDTKYKNGS
jgi:hypothetical protein